MTRLLTTPIALLVLVLLAGLGVAALVLGLALSQPWLGVQLAPAERDAEGAGRVVVETVAQGGPAARAGVAPGAVVVAVAGLALEAGDLIEEPDMLVSFATFDRFMQRQDQLANALRVPLPVVIGLSDGTEARLTPARWRPVSSLPAVFWVQTGVGLFGFVVGGWVFALRRGGRAAGFLVLAGAGLMLSAQAAAVYSTRELALPEGQFRALSAVNHLGALGFGAGMLGLFLCHPMALVRGRWLGVPGIVLGAWWLGNQARLFPDPATGFQMPVALALAGIAVCIGLQWRATRADPRARAALRWFGLSVLIGAGAFVMTVTLPILLGVDAALSQGVAFGFFLPIYGGLALGVARYRLFDLEDWAFRILFYLGGMVLLIALDAALILIIALDRAPAFGVSLLVVALLYLPLRDGLARRLSGARGRRGEGMLFGAVTDVALAPPGASQSDRWHALLRDEFDPLRIEIGPVPPPVVPTLTDDGAALDLPSAGGLAAVRLVWARRGRGLFSPRDAARAGDILSMLTQASASRQAYETGVAEERARIAQDMHDNIGIQLMGALHSASVTRKDALIRETLGDLRDIISNANGSELPLGDLLADLRASLGEHLSAAGLELDWQAEISGDLPLPQRQTQALRSILREAVGNAMRHSGAAKVMVRVQLNAGDGASTLVLTVDDDGRGPDATRPPVSGPGGNGMANMRARAAGLGGNVTIATSPPGGMRVRAVLPLGQDRVERQVP